jgi:hypothetical protein
VNLWLGLRLAVADGRAAAARISLIAAGLAVGVVLLLFSLVVLPALQARIDRYAWHRTDAASPATAPDRALWLPGVVAVHARGAPEEALAPLLAAGPVVVRGGPGGQAVVGCAELARLTSLGCPLPANDDNSGPPVGLFDPTGFAEPRSTTARLPIRTLLVPTDGTPAAQERVRTLAAAAAPFSLARTNQDLGPGQAGVAIWDAGFRLAMAFVLLVAACSLTVAVVSGLIERRRPFALLRASGVRLGELRQIVLLETGIPLLFTVLAGMALALLVVFASARPDQWTLPSGGFFLAAGVATLAAFGLTTIVLPLMDTATRQESVRFE